MSTERHSTGKMTLFTMVFFGTTIVTNVMTARFTAFYETEVLLPINMMVLAILFYTIWDMINDPIAGHLTDRKYRLTRRWGKRFPWLMSASLPVLFILIFFFMPPNPAGSGVWLTFVWFLAFLMLFDGCMSIIGVSYFASLINKFRSDQERLKVASFQQIFSTLGLLIAFIIPPLVVHYGDKSSYVTLALICGVIFLITIIVSIPGQRETKEEIDKYYALDTEQEPFLKSFIGMLKVSLKQKNFRALIIITISLATFNLLFIASIPYYVRYVLQATATTELLLYLPYLLAAFIPIPLYFWMSKRFGHLKLYIISLLLRAIVLFLMVIFYTNLLVILILVAIMGISVGISNITGTPVGGDFYDEAAVINKKRYEGIYFGIQSFFSRTVYIFQLLIFWIIHTLTGFNAEVTAQTELAQFGIIIHMMIIPAIVTLLGVLFFWKIWDLQPDKVLTIKDQIKELKI